MNANPLPRLVPRGEKDTFEFPRRSCVDQMEPAEVAILEAQAAVEKAGADPLLTEAGCLLQRARDKVSDYLEGVCS